MVQNSTLPNTLRRKIHGDQEFITIEKNTLTFATSADKIPEITLLLVSNGISIYSIHAIVKSLEDIFLETINRKALNAPKDSN